MDDYLRAVALGLVQALTEFLPISSSGHLVVAARILGKEADSLTFDIALHLGTLLAVIVYFRRDWGLLLTSLWRDVRLRGSDVAAWRPRSRLGLLIALATVPAVIVGSVVDLLFVEQLRAPLIVGVMLIAGGLELWYLDTRSLRSRRLRRLGWQGALLIGVAQALAVVPGVSRSGATIAGGRYVGLDRPEAATFSFMLSVPVILGAGLLLLRDVIEAPRDIVWGPMLLGAAVSAAAGFAVIHWLLKFLRQRSLFAFVVYRVGAGVGVIVGVLLGAI